MSSGEELGRAIRHYKLAAARRVTSATPTPTGPQEWGSGAFPGARSRASDKRAIAAPTIPRLSQKLRVLCLHGYTQNGDLFRQKTGSMRKAMKGCEFVFPDGPLSAVGAFPSDRGVGETSASMADGSPTDGGQDGVGPLAWWHSGENEGRSPGQPWVRPAESKKCAGFAATVVGLRRLVDEEGPFAGVIAFSQGCSVAAALLREAVGGQCPGAPPPEELHTLEGVRFAVFVGGFLPGDPEVLSFLQGGDSRNAVDVDSSELATLLPQHTLHVTGATDVLVPRARSEDFAGIFEPCRASWFEHPGGHGIPTGAGAFKAALQRLLADAAPQP